jgi:hypothetical protein
VHALGACSSRTSTRDSWKRSSAAACSSACTAPSGSRRSSYSRCTASRRHRPTTSRAPSAWRAT